jgi:butyryl-CoA dehydrogenase
MFDYLLSKERLKIRDEAREFVKWVPQQWTLEMDTETIKFLEESLWEAGRRNLFGCRYPRQWGGRESRDVRKIGE